MAEANKAKQAIANLEAERANQAAEYQRFRKQLTIWGTEERDGGSEQGAIDIFAPSFLGTLTHFQ